MRLAAGSLRPRSIETAALSRPPDPDEPTRRLPPSQPAEPLREREVLTSTELDPAWTQEILDRLRSLRTAIALLGVLSVAALGVGVWALLTQEDEGDAQRGASQERVRELEDRVEALEAETEDAASQDAVEQLRDEQRELEERLSAVEDQSDGAALEDVQADVRQLSDDLEQVGQSIQQLEQRVDDLEQQQAQDSPSP
jgi:DNA repair exonuclease SbcCD ATPase subunit